MSVVIILAATALFGLVHSLTASARFKGWMKRVLGERAYYGLFRLVYNLLALLTLAPALVAVAVLPDRAIYHVRPPWSLALVAVQAVGVLGIATALLQADLLEFAGLRQALALVRGDELPTPVTPFRTNGLYGLVRHPLYLFSLLFLWATPTLTLNGLLFNLGATAYFAIGTFPEERMLARLYGEPYRAYQQRVPRMLPWPRPRLPVAARQSSAN